MPQTPDAKSLLGDMAVNNSIIGTRTADIGGMSAKVPVMVDDPSGQRTEKSATDHHFRKTSQSLHNTCDNASRPETVCQSTSGDSPVTRCINEMKRYTPSLRHDIKRVYSATAYTGSTSFPDRPPRPKRYLEHFPQFHSTREQSTHIWCQEDSSSLRTFSMERVFTEPMLMPGVWVSKSDTGKHIGLAVESVSIETHPLTSRLLDRQNHTRGTGHLRSNFLPPLESSAIIGFDPTLTDRWGNTTLHYFAAQDVHVTAIGTLISLKVDVNMVNNAGEAFMHVLKPTWSAIEMSELLELLRRASFNFHQRDCQG